MSDNTHGLYRGSHIITFSGISIDPLNIDPYKINIDDIAHSLGNLCRYNGHCPRFYSVAEHCVHAVDRAKEVKLSKNTMKHALLHDAAEAYLGDLSRPLKMADVGMAFREAEDLALLAILMRFGVEPNWVTNSAVEQIDRELLAIEANQMFTNAGKWNLVTPTWNVQLHYWDPEYATRMFLDRWDLVNGGKDV